MPRGNSRCVGGFTNLPEPDCVGLARRIGWTLEHGRLNQSHETCYRRFGNSEVAVGPMIITGWTEQ